MIPGFVSLHLTTVIRDNAGVDVSLGLYAIYLGEHFSSDFLHFSVSLLFFLASHFFSFSIFSAKY